MPNKNNILHRLVPRVRLLTDFYVFDVETKVTYKEWCEQRRIFNPSFKIPPKRKGIYWGLKSRPENFVFGVIHGLNYTKVIHNINEFKQTLQEKRFKGRKVFAHNATYDLTTLFGNIFELDPSAIFNGSRFISCTNGNCVFADSMNIFVGQSVNKIGEQLGIVKPDLGENLFSESVGASEINRCSEDCRIVWDALFKSFEFAGDMKITQASLSMTYFRRSHQPFNIEYNENVRYFWSSYYGGRTEMFVKGKCRASVYDVNSMYPDRGRNIEYPNPKHLKVEENVNPKTLSKYLAAYEGCVFADVEHSWNWCGTLPVKKDGKLLFPVGNISGCWNFNELRFALPFLRFKKIQRIVYSERMASPFVSFFDKLFDLKNEASIKGDEFWRDLYKRYQNSLYGKFAQRIDEESIYISDISKEYWRIKEAQEKGIFKKLVIFNAERLECFLVTSKSKNYQVSYSIPSFASYITSAARVKLLEKMLAVGEHNLLYCDTDSVFVRNDFYMQNENFLGGWSIEGGKGKDGIWRPKIVTEIKGLKNYTFIDPKTLSEKRRLKGVPEKAELVGENIYRYFNLIKTKEGMRRNLDAGVLVERGKEISGIYDKRIVLSNGETQPIVL